jgi:hypothetical protein
LGPGGRRPELGGAREHAAQARAQRKLDRQGRWAGAPWPRQAQGAAGPGVRGSGSRPREERVPRFGAEASAGVRRRFAAAGGAE